MSSSPKGFDATVTQSKEQARFGCPKAESSLWGLWNEQNENMESKSENQMTSQDNKSKCTSMWRDESVPVLSKSMRRDERVGTNDKRGTEWEHLRILMEQERQNMEIKPVQVYKCSKGERYLK